MKPHSNGKTIIEWILVTLFLQTGAVNCRADFSPHVLGDSIIVFDDFAASIGDINDDGVNDIAVSSVQYDGHRGMVRIFSGADRSVLGNLYGDNEEDLFGFQIAALGDVDSDGVSDFVVSAREHTSSCNGTNFPDPSSDYSGYVRAFSGANLSILFTKTGSWNTGFGYKVSPIGDQNNDGKNDFLVGAYWQVRDGYPCGDIHGGTIFVYSGTNGALIRTSSSGPQFFPSGLAGVGDVNGDAVEDYVGIGFNPHFVLYSGADGSQLAVKTNYPANGDSWSAVSFIGDITGDGRAEFIVGDNAFNPGNTVGNAKIFSFPNSSLIEVATLQGTSAWEFFGDAVAGLGDVNGDGINDFGVLAGGYSPGFFKGYLKIFSGSTRASIATLFQGDHYPKQNFWKGQIATVGLIDDDAIPDFVIIAQVGLGGAPQNGPTYLMLSNTPAPDDNLYKGSFYNLGNSVVFF